MTENLKNKVAIEFDDGEKLTFLEIENKLDLECAKIGNFYFSLLCFICRAESLSFCRLVKFRAKTKQLCIEHFILATTLVAGT